MNLTLGVLVYWMHNEMQTNKKKAKYSVPWLLLSVIAKLKKEQSDLNARPSSEFSEYELLSLASKPPLPTPKGEIAKGKQKVPLRTLVIRR